MPEVTPQRSPASQCSGASHQPKLPRHERGLGPIQDSQFAEDIGQVVFYGSLGESESYANLLIALSLRKLSKHLALATRQRLGEGRARSCGTGM